MKALLLLPLLLASCVQYHDMYNNQYTSVGGDADVTFPGGGRLTHTHTASLQHVVQGLVALGGSVAGAVVQKSSDSLAGVKDTNAAGVTKNAANNATKQAADSLKAGSADLKTTTQGANFGKLIDTGTFAKGQPLPGHKL